MPVGAWPHMRCQPPACAVRPGGRDFPAPFLPGAAPGLIKRNTNPAAAAGVSLTISVTTGPGPVCSGNACGHATLPLHCIGIRETVLAPYVWPSVQPSVMSLHTRSLISIAVLCTPENSGAFIAGFWLISFACCLLYDHHCTSIQVTQMGTRISL